MGGKREDKALNLNEEEEKERKAGGKREAQGRKLSEEASRVMTLFISVT